MSAFLPAIFLALLTFNGGTFAGAAEFAGAVTAHAGVLAFCTLAGERWRDPLSLGRRGRWLVPAALLAIAASWWAGPVPRAGVVALLLLPAFLLVPAAAANCWREVSGRQRGVASLCLLLGVVAVQALLQWQLQGSPRAAMPLGHHNLLAGWLITLWPVALLPARWGGAWRVIHALVAAAGVVALTVCSSFLAGWAFLFQAVAAAIWWKRARVWLALALVAVYFGPAILGLRGPEVPGPVSQLERARDVVARADSSTTARAGYARAGWEGFTRRPLLGWGPGAVPWTVASFHRPVAGLNPPSEIVGDLHSLPVQAAYELGIAGAAGGVAMLVLFARRRFQELRRTEGLRLPLAACIGLAGSAVFALGNAPVSVLALPAAVLVVAGAALPPRSPNRENRSRASLPIILLYVLPAALVLAPYELGHFHYQRAIAATSADTALASIERASELDPEFPLYRARSAWLAAALEGPDPAIAGNARRAAEQARAVAPLWLAAGALAIEAGEPWAEEALETARRLDPLSPLPAIHLLRVRPDRRDAEELARFVLSAEPRLRAAVFWERHPELWQRVAPPGASAMIVPDPPGATVRLALSMDDKTAVSFSLFAFRRSPWPADLAPVELRAGRLP